MKNTLGDETLPDVDLTSNSPRLTNEEKNAFARFDKDLRFDNSTSTLIALRSTYENLLYIGLCMVFIKRKGLVITPSKKTEAAAKKAVIAHKSRRSTL